jgi:hypothetical protein
LLTRFTSLHSETNVKGSMDNGVSRATCQTKMRDKDEHVPLKS